MAFLKKKERRFKGLENLDLYERQHTKEARYEYEASPKSKGNWMRCLDCIKDIVLVFLAPCISCFQCWKWLSSHPCCCIFASILMLLMFGAGAYMLYCWYAYPSSTLFLHNYSNSFSQNLDSTLLCNIKIAFCL